MAILPRYLGIELPAIIAMLPTELPVVDIHMEQFDILFLLEDGSLLHIEFQTTSRHQDLPRFLVYDALLYARTGKDIHTIIIYGAGIEAAAEEIRSGSTIHYMVHNVFLGKEDGDAVLERINRQVAAGRELSQEDQLDLILQILMRHRAPRREAIAEAVSIARRLPENEQRQTLAALLGVGSRFLREDELERLVQAVMSTPTGLQLLERRYEEGRQEGIELGLARARREDIQTILTSRFGKVPEVLVRRLESVTEMELLNMLFGLALNARSLKEFTQGMPE